MITTNWGTVHGLPPWGIRGRSKKRGEADWEKYIGTMPSLTEEQQAVSTPMSEYLAEAIAGIGTAPSFEEWSKGNIPDAFSGVLGGQAQGVYSEAMKGITPDMFGGELGSEAKAAYAEAMSGIAPDVFGGELGDEVKAAYGQAITGEGVFDTPDMFGGELGAEAKSAYAEALRGEPVGYDPSGANFLQNVIPAIKESYVGTGAITGTEVGREIGRQAEVEKENIARVKAGLFNQAKQRQLTAAINYRQAFEIRDEAGKNRALSAAGMYQTAYQSGQEQAKQRQLMAAGNYQQAYQSAVQAAKDRAQTAAGSYQQMQMELTKLAYDNYVRQNPAATEVLQSALSYLNISMMAAYQKPKPTKEKGGWKSMPNKIMNFQATSGGASTGFNQGAGSKSQTSAPPEWDPNSLVAKLEYWDYYNIPEEKRHPTIGEAMAKMMNL